LRKVDSHVSTIVEIRTHSYSRGPGVRPRRRIFP
jgi:hypothetical protein